MKKRPVVWICLAYIAFLMVFLVVKPEWGEAFFKWQETEKEIRKRYVNADEIQGQVLSVEEKKETYHIRIKLEDGTVCIGIVPMKEQVFPGDDIKIKGKIQWPGAPGNPGEWNGRLYARIHRFYFYIQGEEIQIIKRNKWTLQKQFFLWKERLSNCIDKQWDMPWSGIITSVLLGEKGGLESSIKDTWSQSGIAHVMAISGLHLTVL